MPGRLKPEREIRRQRVGQRQQVFPGLCRIIILLIVVLSQCTVSSAVGVGNAPPAPNAWRTGNLQRSYSDPNLETNRNFTFRRPAPNANHHIQRHHSLDDRNRTPKWDGHCSTNYKFDYVQLTLQWPPGACSTSPQECKKIQNKHFTIHGMWPTKRGTREPANCCFDNHFDFNALKPILPDLDEYWYSFFDSSSRGFWSHEWLKHGTCSRDVPSLVGEANYFGTTLKIAKSIPILQELAKAGVVPNRDEKVYSSDQLVKTIKSSITSGKNFQIDCDYEHHQPVPVLTGLNFCFDSNLQPADCPDMKSMCKRQILFRS